MRRGQMRERRGRGERRWPPSGHEAPQHGGATHECRRGRIHRHAFKARRECGPERGEELRRSGLSSFLRIRPRRRGQPQRAPRASRRDVEQPLALVSLALAQQILQVRDERALLLAHDRRRCDEKLAVVGLARQVDPANRRRSGARVVRSSAGTKT